MKEDEEAYKIEDIVKEFKQKFRILGWTIIVIGFMLMVAMVLISEFSPIKLIGVAFFLILLFLGLYLAS